MLCLQFESHRTEIYLERGRLLENIHTEIADATLRAVVIQQDMRGAEHSLSTADLKP